MTTWILTWVIWSGGNTATSSQEYATPKACLVAKKAQSSVFSKTKHYAAVCTAKTL